MGIEMDEDIDIKDGEKRLIGLYAGIYTKDTRARHPSRLCVSIAFYTEYYHAAGEELPVDWFVVNSVSGPFMNAAASCTAANCTLERGEYFIDSNDNMWISIYDTCSLKREKNCSGITVSISMLCINQVKSLTGLG